MYGEQCVREHSKIRIQKGGLRPEEVNQRTPVNRQGAAGGQRRSFGVVCSFLSEHAGPGQKRWSGEQGFPRGVLETGLPLKQIDQAVYGRKAGKKLFLLLKMFEIKTDFRNQRKQGLFFNILE